MMTMYPAIPTVLKDGAEMPQYSHDGDAGLDLCATEDVTLMPQEWKMVGSGVSMAIPKGFAGLVVPRSGMGCKGLVLKNTLGIIDAPYRGEIKVPLLNNNPTHVWVRDYEISDEMSDVMRNMMGDLANTMIKELSERPPYLKPNNEGTITVHKGDRVAQLLIVPVAMATLLQVDSLDETSRGEGGFGSTNGVRL